MKRVFFVGWDIAKNVFQVFLADEHGHQIAKKNISRSNMKSFFANLEPCTIGLEACGSSHYWARTPESYGHTVRLIQPIRVKAFLGNHNKSDAAYATLSLSINFHFPVFQGLFGIYNMILFNYYRYIK